MPKRPVALEDLLRLQLAGDTQISPDGLRIVYTVKRIDAEKNRYCTRLWMADVEKGESRPFTADRFSDSGPRWSPDGSQIAFVSERGVDDKEKKSQIYLIPADGGEAESLTKLDEGAIQGLAWSPDGSKIAFLYRRTPAQWTREGKDEREDNHHSTPVRVHKKIFYRLDAFGYFDEQFWQVWVADAKTGEAKALTDEPLSHGDPCWSPDGRMIGFIANRREDNDLKQDLDDIWIVPAEGGELTQVEAEHGPKRALAWSPDGMWLAYAGHTDPDDSWGGRNDRILLTPVTGSDTALDLTGASDKAVGYLTMSDVHETGGGREVHWSPDSRTLYFPISEQGATLLYRVNFDGTGLQALTPADQEMGAISLSADARRFGLLLGNGTEFYDAYAGEVNGGLQLRRMGNVNEDLLEEARFQTPEEMRLPNGDGGSIHTWLMKPPGFSLAERYPCVVYVHGGPSLQYGGKAAPLHEHQWLAANGYVVIFSNPRGSKGYGEAYTKSIKGNWGSVDWKDVQSVADYAASLPYVDPARMAIMGGSYGGYMTAWAVGHTDRFRCAITDRLVGNVHSMSGTCDFPWEHGKFYQGNAWDDPSDLWRVSPLHFAGDITTPLLIIHSDGDLRCPVGQAEELFAALRMQRKEVEFVRYPAESSHGLSRMGPPDLRLDRLRRNLAWLDRWLKAN